MVALALPASAQTTQTYCSGTPVMIPASGATSGAPDPYPTTITVSGLAGAITDQLAALFEVDKRKRDRWMGRRRVA